MERGCFGVFDSKSAATVTAPASTSKEIFRLTEPLKYFFGCSADIACSFCRVAVISDEILERAREGSIPMLTDMMEYGATILKREHVMEGVADMLTILQVEALFPDGTKLVTVMNPIRD